MQACLTALAGQTARDFEVIVVDNGSTDGSVEWLKQNWPGIRVIANSANMGFAGPVNQGIEASTSPFVAVLNNDTEPEYGWLAELLRAIESDPCTGMAASKMLFADRPNMINSAGICVDVTGIAWDRFGGEPDDRSQIDPVYIFGPSAGAALYRRDMLEEIGLFDRSFFAYLEDVDLAWRGRAAGWCCVYAPQARVLHHHSATGVEGSPFKSYQLGRNKVWLLAKNYPFGQLWWAAPLVILYDLAAVVYALVARRDLHALRGRLAGLMSLGPMLGKRQRQPVRHDIPWLAPLIPPWRVRTRYEHISAQGRTTSR